MAIQTHSLDLGTGAENKYASVTHNAAFDFGTGDFTIEFWAKLADTTVDTTENIIRHYNSGGWVVQFKSDRSISFFAGPSGESVSAAGAIPNDTNWHHYAFVRAGATGKVYVDGALVSVTGALSASSLNKTTDLYIGSNGSSEDFDGLLKDVRIFSDERTASEISVDMWVATVVNANLIAEWNFNNSYADTSGSGLTLTPANSPTFSTDIVYVAAEVLRPTGAGDETNLTTQVPASTSHWDKVDEAVPDEATTNVSQNGDNTTGRDLYALADSSVGAGTINKVTVRVRHAGQSAKAWIKTALKTNGTVYDGAQVGNLELTYTTFCTDYATNPQTGAAWTWSEVNAMQAGLSMHRDPTQEGHTTQVFAVVDYTPVTVTTSAVTKTAQYAVKKTNAITKTAQYEVKSVSALTKAAQYAVKTAGHALTTGLQYAVKTVTEITKGLQYEVKSPHALTLATKYTVTTTPAAITKGAQYAVTTTTPTTKGLQYAVKKGVDITLGAQYEVLSLTELTQELKYTVKAPAAITRALRYAVFLGSTELTAAAAYSVRKATDLALAAKYTVLAAAELTKGLQYAISGSKSTTKGLQYAIVTSGEVSLSAAYEVKVEGLALTKQLKYVVKGTQEISLQAKYEVITAGLELTKGLEYRVRTSEEVPLSAIYAVKKEREVQLNLTYIALYRIELTKTARYAVRRTIPLTLSAAYEVEVSTALTKQLRYVVHTTPAAITKQLKYVVRVYPYSRKTSPYYKLKRVVE